MNRQENLEAIDGALGLYCQIMSRLSNDDGTKIEINEDIKNCIWENALTASYESHHFFIANEKILKERRLQYK